MFLIGLTGGFLTGKSSLAKFLKARGLEVLDVDSLYTALLKKGYFQKALVKLAGEDILFKGKVSKKRLRQKLIAEPSLLKKLESLTHPLIIREMKRMIRLFKGREKFLVVEVPLLYEANLEKFFDKIVVVSSSLKEQFQRARKRGYTIKEAKFFINNQLPLKVKEEKADWVIRNTGTLEELKAKAYLLLKELENIGNKSGKSKIRA